MRFQIAKALDFSKTSELLPSRRRRDSYRLIAPGEEERLGIYLIPTTKTTGFRAAKTCHDNVIPRSSGARREILLVSHSSAPASQRLDK